MKKRLFVGLAALACLVGVGADAAPQRVTFPSADGLTLQVWLYAPMSADPHRAVGACHDFDHPDLPVHAVDGLAFAADGGGQAHG